MKISYSNVMIVIILQRQRMGYRYILEVITQMRNINVPTVTKRLNSERQCTHTSKSVMTGCDGIVKNMIIKPNQCSSLKSIIRRYMTKSDFLAHNVNSQQQHLVICRVIFKINTRKEFSSANFVTLKVYQVLV